MKTSLTIRAAAAAVLLLGWMEGADAGPTVAATLSRSGGSDVLAAQYYGYGPGIGGYRRPYGYYRPYGFYRPYGYGPGPRYYANHYGPGAAKERYRTRLDFCLNKPERC